VQNNPRWMELAKLASQEQDPKKLLALIEEINELLATKQRRLEQMSPEKQSE
jgi:hypothetical protein